MCFSGTSHGREVRNSRCPGLRAQPAHPELQVRHWLQRMSAWLPGFNCGIMRSFRFPSDFSACEYSYKPNHQARLFQCIEWHVILLRCPRTVPAWHREPTPPSSFNCTSVSRKAWPQSPSSWMVRMNNIDVGYCHPRGNLALPHSKGRKIREKYESETQQMLPWSCQSHLRRC